MAGAPVSELVARIIASDEASETLAKVSEQVEATAKRFVSSNKRAQEQIAALIARGDPAKQAKIQADKEIEQAQRIAKARPQLAEQAAAAEVAIRRRLADTLAKIDSDGAAKASAGQVSLQAAAKGATETVSKVASLANVAGTAFGGMGGAAGQAATSIVGAFGAGGPVAIAIAATAATIGLVAVEWKKISDAIAAQQAENKRLRLEAINQGTQGEEAALKALAELDAKPGDKSADTARGFGDFASSQAKVAADRAKSAEAMRASLAAAEARLATAREEARGEADKFARSAANARAAAAKDALDELKTKIKNEQAEADDAAAAATNAAKAAAAYMKLSAAEQKKAKAKTDAKEAAKVPDLKRQGRDVTGRKAEASMAAWEAGNQQAAVVSGPTAADFERERARQDQESADAAFRTKMLRVSEDSAKLSADAWQFEFSAASGFIDGMAERGDSAMTAFMGAMDAARKRDAPGLIGGILQAFGAVASIFGPAGAAVGMLASSAGALLQKFDHGGAPYAIGRRGLATLPGGNDGIPAVLHPNEFTFSAPAVRAAGGVGALAQQHEALIAGRGGGQRSGGTTINVVALDPQMAVGVLERSVEPAMTTRLSARQGALYRAELQRAARGPRSGV